MEESFELLSSMSPKLKGRQKTVKKAIKILALKKHIRHSSIYDKGPSVRNEDLAIVERSTESSETSSNFQENICKNDNDNKKNVIIIDSTDSESSEDLPVPKTKKVSSKFLRNSDKKATANRIQKWVENIDTSQNKDSVTFFSQVSTIYGDEDPKFDPDGNGLAACSTFNEYMIRRFDEIFISDKTGLEKKPNDVCISEDSFSDEINLSLRTKLTKKPQDKVANNNVPDKDNKSFNSSKDSLDLKKNTNEVLDNIIIDETLLTSDESIVNPSNKYESPVLSPKLDSERTPKRPLTNLGDNITTRKKNVNILHEPTNSPFNNSLEMEEMLDSLYGEKWREKQNHVVPLSEPRKKLDTKNEKKILTPNTERILRPSSKDNVRFRDNLATKKLNFVRLNTPVVSPWVERLKGLIDSDSDSNSEKTNKKNMGIDSVKTRLNFCDDSPMTKPFDVQNSKTQCDDKEKVDDSYYNQSLEERIRKKMNNIKIPTKINKDCSKKGARSKNNENNPHNENKNKGKSKAVHNENKKISILENDSKKNTTKKTNNSYKMDKKISTHPSSYSCSEIEISSDEEYDKEVTRMYEVKRKSIMPLKEGGRYSFLESLSASIPLDKCDMAARIFRTSFKHYRSELTKKLFSLYNEKVFDKTIPGDTELEWNDKLRNTAGLCYCKKITHRDGNVVRKVRISLSSKVLDSPDRLRDTLIHEMCHAATWIINQISNGHGIYWKNWAFKAMKVFPELPPIRRCHSYQINTKYTYKCTGCGYSIGRHSKSLDTEGKRCGHCYGKFELLINKTLKSGVTRTVPVTPRKQATAFSVFVKENYALYKEPSKKHGDVMKILGQKFSELKVKTGA